LIQDKPDPLTSSPDPGDDEPLGIPLSTAEKCVFALENCPATVKNLFQISSLNVIRPNRATAEIGCILGVPATDRQRNSAARLGLAEFGT
jgi:hypothetical protein